MKKVFLGGTCNNSTWRDDMILLLSSYNIDWFNPVVKDWTPECQAQELEERENCDFVLYTITPQMTGVYSIAEAVDDSNKRPQKTIFVYLAAWDGVTFDSAQIKSLEATAQMIKENGANVFDSLHSAALYIGSKV